MDQINYRLIIEKKNIYLLKEYYALVWCLRCTKYVQHSKNYFVRERTEKAI